MGVWDIAENVVFLTVEWPVKSARQIAMAIGCSRNAVISKANRIGLCAKKAPPRTAFAPKAPSGRKFTIPRREQGPYTGPSKFPLRGKPADLPSDDRPGIDILALSHRTCRAVINVDDRRYCGLEVHNEKTYCPGHYSLYYQPPNRP